MSKRLRVAIIAPPWLALPIKGYGGIELVLEGLIDGLKKLDVDVEVFANGAHKCGVSKRTHFTKKNSTTKYTTRIMKQSGILTRICSMQ